MVRIKRLWKRQQVVAESKLATSTKPRALSLPKLATATTLSTLPGMEWELISTNRHLSIHKTSRKFYQTWLLRSNREFILMVILVSVMKIRYWLEKKALKNSHFH